ncbi:integral membrane protein [Ophiostoma piceae UAMH 11346]|uniref:Integral membrane protein n=1 Tax=Ophiostoma piceae (strain UAMH 11346) TaxID=1262450 RepID=S3CM31_OPHP1|nr:integral membrane protein [Ophiostoma piceae UAMH 11346]
MSISCARRSSAVGAVMTNIGLPTDADHAIAEAFVAEQDDGEARVARHKLPSDGGSQARLAHHVDRHGQPVVGQHDVVPYAAEVENGLLVVAVDPGHVLGFAAPGSSVENGRPMDRTSVMQEDEVTMYFTIAQITYVAYFPIVRLSVAMVLLRITKEIMPRICPMVIASMVIVVNYALDCILVDALQ